MSLHTSAPGFRCITLTESLEEPTDRAKTQRIGQPEPKAEHCLAADEAREKQGLLGI